MQVRLIFFCTILVLLIGAIDIIDCIVYQYANLEMLAVEYFVLGNPCLIVDFVNSEICCFQLAKEVRTIVIMMTNSFAAFLTEENELA